MGRTKWQLPELLDKLRWVIPALMAALGIGYTQFKYYLISPGSITPVYVLREAVIIGTVGPTLVWFLLTWATRIAESRQKAMESLRWRALQLEATSQVSRKVTAILEIDELLAQVVALIQNKFGYYHVHLFLVDGGSNEIVMQACEGQDCQTFKVEGLRLKIGEQGITGRVAQDGQFMLCNDVAKESRYHPHELLPETRSELAIPLRIGDVVVGVLDVQSKHLNAFEDGDVTALQVLGDQVAIAIENANLFRETRHQFEVMRGLHRISLDITSQLKSEQVLAVILEQAVNLLNARASGLALYNPQTGLIHIIAVHNLPADFQGMALRVGEGAAGRVVETRKPLIVTGYQNWPGRSRVLQDSPYDALVSVPLRWKDEVFGALTVADLGEYRSFTKDDVQLLSLFADLASIALKNADLYEQVVQLSQQLEQKVEQRTDQLVKTQEELAHKAAELQRLLTVVVRVQEEERARIALDLHDGSNQLITGTLFEIQAAQQSIIGQRKTVALEKLETAKRLLREIEAENRRIITGLRPPILDAQGLAPALKWHVDAFQEYYGINCSAHVSGQPVRLTAEAEIAIFRIVQESLNNIVAHAQAQSVQVSIEFSPLRLRAVVEDDGIGFIVKSVLAAAPGRMGLVGMRERAQSLGGRIGVESEPGIGTRIVLDLPLSPELLLEPLLEPTLGMVAQ